MNQKKNQNKDWSIIFDFLKDMSTPIIADKNYVRIRKINSIHVQDFLILFLLWLNTSVIVYTSD